MRQAHLTYLRDLAASIRVGNHYPYRGNDFYELPPSTWHFENRVPCAIVGYKETVNRMNGKLWKRIANGTQYGGPLHGHATQRFLKQLYQQKFGYTLDFWTQNPVMDLHSDPLSPAGQTDDPGILDQALKYVAENRIIEHGLVKIIVTTGASGLVTEFENWSSIYKLYIEITFIDGLYSLEEFSTLDGAEQEIAAPEVETQ